MEITVSQVNGIIKIQERKNGILYKRMYIDYTKKECIADFKDYIKNV